MLSFDKVKDLQNFLDKKKIEKVSIGFVPTMGALHSGHLSLIKRAKIENDIVVCSIFVNPTQFNDPKDLENYPRPINKDIILLEEAKCDILFIPPVEQVYPDVRADSNHQQFVLKQRINVEKYNLLHFDGNHPEEETKISESALIEKKLNNLNLGVLTQVMEGKFRTGHFEGVLNVVYRLFDIVKPERAYFGEKDFQQLAVIKQMVKQLFLPVEIIPCPIIREADGLAMSSRNQLLSEEERIYSSILSKTLFKAKELSKTLSVPEVKDFVVKQLSSKPSVRLEYFEISDIETLAPVSNWKDAPKSIGCVAVFVGKVRLIDNIVF